MLAINLLRESNIKSQVKKRKAIVKHNEGMPKLKELPLLGWLFGQRKHRNSDYEVWIMIRPSILGKN